MHKFDLKNRTAVVTGGAQGFGLDIAKRFLDSGAKVYIWDIDEKLLKTVIDEIKNYKLIFDMKFREDYEGDFLGVCVGPSWKDFGPGEFSIILNNNNNFKNSIVGKFLEDNDDGCDIYHYYVRFFEVETLDQTLFLIGVATDYAKEYPDAPYIWKQNKNNDLEIIGTSNIEKYSLNFELSK